MYGTGPNIGKRRKRRRKRRKRKKRLENKIYVFKNKDKLWHEKWIIGKRRIKDPSTGEIQIVPKYRPPMDVIHPFRVIQTGEPNIGKSNNSVNLLIHQETIPFERCVVIHEDPETREYDLCDAEIIGDIPDKDFFDRDVKTLVIIDDIDVGNIKGVQKHRLNRMFGNWSTHRNISVCLNAQHFYECPPIVRRCCNVIILGKNKDLKSRSSIASKIGMTPDKLNSLYKTFMHDDHDMLWFDMTKLSPYKLRLNGPKPLRLKKKKNLEMD